MTASGLGKLNAFTVSIPVAREIAEKAFAKVGRLLDKEYPLFDEGLSRIQALRAVTLPIRRVDMPVIRQKDVHDFDDALKAGALDIFKPYAMGRLFAPAKLSPQDGDEWVELGFQDGSLDDDKMRGVWGHTAAKDMKPIQREIWLDKLIGLAAKKGGKAAAEFGKKMTMIMSADNYIIDGHHRWGAAMLYDPNMRLRTLTLPMPIDLLLKVARTYGAARGNTTRG